MACSSNPLTAGGGGYAYVRETLSGLVSFVMGWTRWFTYMVAGALYALGFSSNFVEFVHIYFPPAPSLPVVYTLAVIVLFVVLNAVSTAASGGAETLIATLKIEILALSVGFGVFAAETTEFNPLFPSQGGAVTLLPAMGLTFMAFQGYDLIATVTEEVDNPRRSIPRAIFLSLGVTVVVYLLVVFVAIGTLGAEQLGAAASFMPTIPLLGSGAAIITFGAVFSTVSALNAVVIGSSRVAYAMGREGQLPLRLGQLHPRFGTPFLAIIASSVLMLVSVVLVPIRVVGNLASLFSLLGFIVVNGEVELHCQRRFHFHWVLFRRLRLGT